MMRAEMAGAGSRNEGDRREGQAAPGGSAEEALPGHRQVRIEHEGMSADVDEGIAEVVLALWRLGFDTISSCEHLEGTAVAFVGFPTVDDAERFDGMIPNGKVVVPIEEDYAAVSEESFEAGFSGWGSAAVGWPHEETGVVLDALRRAEASGAQ
jgi:hypothetical protein